MPNKNLTNKKERLKQGNVALERQELHVGPIPTPDHLAKYNEIDSSFANRIMVMAENEQKHRHIEDAKLIKTQRAVLRSDAISRFVSPGFALLAVTFICALSAYAFYLDHPKSGTTIATTIVIGLAGAFLKQQSNKSSKRKN